MRAGASGCTCVLHVLVWSSFTLIYLIAKADGALSDKGMVLWLLGTNLWKLPGTCSTNLNFSWDSPGMPLTLPCSHVPWFLRQRMLFLVLKSFSNRLFWFFLSIHPVFMLYCWYLTGILLLAGGFSPFGKVYAVSFRAPPAPSTLPILCQRPQPLSEVTL